MNRHAGIVTCMNTHAGIVLYKFIDLHGNPIVLFQGSPNPCAIVVLMASALFWSGVISVVIVNGVDMYDFCF